MTRPGAPLPSLLSRAMTQVLGAVPGGDDTDAKVLDAALRVLARRGTREATMDDIAAESGVGRTTLFRRYASKDQLFERALARDMGRFLDDLAERFTVVTDPTEQVVIGFIAGLGLGDHILFRDADQVRRAELLQALGHGDPSPISLGYKAVRANIAKAQADGKIPVRDPDAQADALVHLMIGYLAAPSFAVDLTDPAAVERLARAAVAPILTGTI
ncbi:TetR/AcrR family transcriptional regulator [Nocardia cyriacigeorgica]|uniref:TetR/AcrR family transcriptional regulator n=1 Tax=Nocardia cyriacigeorgica TaxID=135487 RepID=UPI0013CF6144|nr:TetR/AcrR family transcriptional regulator [Nocardia cyriacigeorgica]MBF6434828.1 TetR/AcrR family transcriptional regulator [Nocardia cyriacigeorgica]MBF6455088.1 TetR/AcrR family transcriptional regulator [Nocardia cyriacigeorgica]MBF6477930.1 TetR/AcrR family transcriptional regulator [Nocardia cyriacigeorgica]MBF6552983.1 TetR/AcrR family transcriptional regulator [Nocardia cyriacigeorgica]NEW26780.1 TetR/AcrR family transcriptional regulator [Nocardia cyriacigeorgica]